MNRWWIIIFILIFIIVFPKSYVKGGLGGFIQDGDTNYKEELSCFGLKHVKYSEGCSDCGPKYNCYGVTYGKTCFEESYVNGTMSKEEVVC